VDPEKVLRKQFLSLSLCHFTSFAQMIITLSPTVSSDKILVLFILKAR